MLTSRTLCQLQDYFFILDNQVSATPDDVRLIKFPLGDVFFQNLITSVQLETESEFHLKANDMNSHSNVSKLIKVDIS